MEVEKKPRARKSATKTTPAGATPKPRATPKPKAQAVAPEQVAERAYELWESGADGDQLEHWLRAERELATA